MKFSEGVQKFISFGYPFLIVMGVLKESLFYGQIGINILHYSSITDILLSPIADLTSNLIIFAALIFLLIMSYAMPLYFSKNINKKWLQKSPRIKYIATLSKDEIEKEFTNMFVGCLALTTLSFFVGFGYGQGEKLSERIKTNKLKYEFKLTFNSGESEQIHLIGSNSLYHFYVTQGNNDIKIAPIGSIKNIEITFNKILQ